jgi:hypothetical protein
MCALDCCSINSNNGISSYERNLTAVRIANVIVMRDLYERERLVIARSKLLVVEGRFSSATPSLCVTQCYKRLQIFTCLLRVPLNTLPPSERLRESLRNRYRLMVR